MAVSATPIRRHRTLTKKLFEIGIKRRAKYFLQGEMELVTFHDPSVGRSALLEDRERTLLLNTPHGRTVEETRAWVKGHAEIHLSYEAWRQALQSVDLLVGARIHGAIMALNSGVRAALASCDARTSELAAFLNIPCISPAELDQIAAGVFSTDYYPSNYLATYADRLDNYLVFLKQNELPCRIANQSTALRVAEAVPPLQADVEIGAAAYEREYEQIRRDARVIPNYNRAAAEAFIAASHNSMTINIDTSAQAPSMERSDAMAPSDSRSAFPAEPTLKSPGALETEIQTLVARMSECVQQYILASGENPYFMLPQIPMDIPEEKLRDAKMHTSRMTMMMQLGGAAGLEIRPHSETLTLTLLDLNDELSLVYAGENVSCLAKYAVDNGLAPNRLTLMEGVWMNDLATMKPLAFDWIFFESPSSRDETMQLLQLSKRILKQGGHIVLGNYTAWSLFEARPYGVVQAVNEFLNLHDYSVSHFVLQRFGYSTIVLKRDA